MTRTRRRWLRPRIAARIAVNVPLFVVGLALILGPTVGLEVGGVQLPALQSWWTRGLLMAVGVGIVFLSLLATEPPPAPAGNPPQRLPAPLPPLVPGTAFVGNVPALPSRFVARSDVLDTVRDQVASHATVGLVGMGGAGKTILAIAVARDPAIQAAFPDGIAWVDADQQATPTQLQERLAARLTGEAASFPTVEEGRHRLAELLAGRAFLLVVDDVWDTEALNALNVVGAPRGRCCSPPATAASPAPPAPPSTTWMSWSLRRPWPCSGAGQRPTSTGCHRSPTRCACALGTWRWRSPWSAGW